MAFEFLCSLVGQSYIVREIERGHVIGREGSPSNRYLPIRIIYIRWYSVYLDIVINHYLELSTHAPNLFPSQSGGSNQLTLEHMSRRIRYMHLNKC